MYLQNSPWLAVHFSYIWMIMKYAGDVRFSFTPQKSGIVWPVSYVYCLSIPTFSSTTFCNYFYLLCMGCKLRADTLSLADTAKIIRDQQFFPWMREWLGLLFLKCHLLDAEEKETIPPYAIFVKILNFISVSKNTYIHSKILKILLHLFQWLFIQSKSGNTG